MTSPAITSVFNDAYIAEVYESYRRDPASVDESWRQYFRTAEALAGLVGGAPQATGGGDPDLPRKAAAAAALLQGIREQGHLAVQLDACPWPALQDIVHLRVRAVVMRAGVLEDLDAVQAGRGVGDVAERPPRPPARAAHRLEGRQVGHHRLRQGRLRHGPFLHDPRLVGQAFSLTAHRVRLKA